MRTDDDAYTGQLQALLPPGAAWTHEPDAVLTRLLGGLAGELARVHNRAVDLTEEALPPTSDELLADWERVCGLPDPCGPPPETLEDRRRAVVARLRALGGQSLAYYEGMCAELGWEVEARDYTPFRAGSPAGDGLYNDGRPLRAGWGCAGDPVVDDRGWRFTWTVTGDPSFFDVLTAGGGAGSPLRAWGNPAIECAVRPRRPGHTRVFFHYREPKVA